MKKQGLLLGLGFVLLISVGFMVYKIREQIQFKKQIAQNIRTLPLFSFYNLDSLAYKSTQIIDNQLVIIIYFNSECEHCQYEAQAIERSANLFKDTQILMISSESLPNIRSFTQKYKLNRIPFIQILKTDGNTFYQHFGTVAIPAIFIYNRQKQLVKQFKGEVKIETILKYLK